MPGAATVACFLDAGFAAINAGEHIGYPLLDLSQDSATVPAVFIKPQGLNSDEMLFVRDLVQWFRANDAPIPGAEVFFLRNESRGSGLGFFIADTFYPNFILWFVTPETRTIVFVDPKGIRNQKGFDNDPQLLFSQRIKEIQDRLNRDQGTRSPELRLESFIISATAYPNVTWNLHAAGGAKAKVEFEQRHVFFMDDEDCVDRMMGGVTQSISDQWPDS